MNNVYTAMMTAGAKHEYTMHSQIGILSGSAMGYCNDMLLTEKCCANGVKILSRTAYMTASALSNLSERSDDDDGGVVASSSTYAITA